MRIAVACLVGIAGFSCTQNPKESKTQEQEFKYLVDEFADLKVIRYKVPGWDDLSLQQKSFIYYMGEAAKCGRDIFWDQNFKHNLEVRRALENVLESYTGDRETPEFKEFLVYAKRIFFSNGIHHHYAEEKILPGCTSEYMKHLLENSQDIPDVDRMVEIMCDPGLFKMRKSSGTEGDLLMTSATNFYSGVTRAEAEAFYRSLEKPGDPRPVEYGLNSRLVKKDGEITEETYTTEGLYGPALQQICHWLEKAAEVAESPEQASYLKTLINYYQTGDLALWDAFNVAWVQDTDTELDFVNGFVEVYGDPLGRKGSWEGNVNYIDKEASRRTAIISGNAQWPGTSAWKPFLPSPACRRRNPSPSPSCPGPTRRPPAPTPSACPPQSRPIASRAGAAPGWRCSTAFWMSSAASPGVASRRPCRRPSPARGSRPI